MTADPLAAEAMSNFNALVGYRLVDWRDDVATVELTLDERHMNRAGVVHGGVLATMLDAALGYAGVYSPATGTLRKAVTLSVTTSFLGQATRGTLRCTARRRGGGKTIFMATGEIRDGDGRLIATGEGVFRYIGAAPR